MPIAAGDRTHRARLRTQWHHANPGGPGSHAAVNRLRRSIVPLAAGGLALALVGGVAGPAAPSAVPGVALAADPTRSPAPPPGLRAFMGGLAAVESGGRYDARNPRTGAYGRYQVMPSNWPGWARRYAGNSKASPTPPNQERVVAGRLGDLFRSVHGRWADAAYWWLTGKRGPRETWSGPALRYVRQVMAGYRIRLATPAGRGRVVLDDRSDAIVYAGAWREAAHRGYAGGHARFSVTPGSTAAVRFTGRSVRIEGPTGPPRGRVRVVVDGRVVRTVDLRAATFHARRVLFAATWRARGTHRVELRVLATRGRHVVAIDRVVVGG